MFAASFARLLAPEEDGRSLSHANPKIRYLRGQVLGHPPAFLVLGYIESDPHGGIEVWYSATGEVIKIQNGRIVATAGLAVDWRRVQISTIHAHSFERMRDVMPGYQFGVQDIVNTRPWQGLPATKLPTTLTESKARSYTWVRESIHSTTGEALPPAWFAWGQYEGMPAVVYSEQCLTATFCLTLQRWPVQ
jgi:hypothetical protein